MCSIRLSTDQKELSLPRKGRHKNPNKKVHEEEWSAPSLLDRPDEPLEKVEEEDLFLSFDPPQAVNVPAPPPEKHLREGHLWEIWGLFVFMMVSFFYGLHLISLLEFDDWWPRALTLIMGYLFIIPLEGIVYWRVWMRGFGRCFTASAWMNGVMMIIMFPLIFLELGPSRLTSLLALFGLSFLINILIEGILAQYYLFRGLPFRQIVRGVVVANATTYLAASLFFSGSILFRILHPSFIDK